MSKIRSFTYKGVYAFIFYSAHDKISHVHLKIFGKTLINTSLKINNEKWEYRKDQALEFFLKLNPFPVYYWHWGRDCDGVEAAHTVKYENGRTAIKSIESSYEWADGPMSFTRISKRQYNQYKSEGYTRDRYAEMDNY